MTYTPSATTRARSISSCPSSPPTSRAFAPARVDAVHPVLAGRVARHGRAARDREDVPDTLGVGAEEDRLEAGERHVARRQMRNGLDAGEPLDGDRRHDPAHSRARPRVVVD